MKRNGKGHTKAARMRKRHCIADYVAESQGPFWPRPYVLGTFYHSFYTANGYIQTYLRDMNDRLIEDSIIWDYHDRSESWHGCFSFADDNLTAKNANRRQLVIELLGKIGAV